MVINHVNDATQPKYDCNNWIIKQHISIHIFSLSDMPSFFTVDLNLYF